MKPPVIGIVTTYNEECGIASYSSNLKEKLVSCGYHIEIIKLESALIRSRSVDSSRRRAIDKHDNLNIKLIRTCDLLIFQIEPGIYGNSYRGAYNRIFNYQKHSKSCIFVYHTYHSNETSTKEFLANIRNPINLYRQLGPQRFFKKLTDLLNKKKWSIIVHTKREAFLLECDGLSKDLIYDFPLAYQSVQEIQYNAQRRDETKFELLEKYGLPNDTILIGLFGFISKYKGHMTALKALSLLSSRYRLIIFGNAHPASIVKFQSVDPFQQELIDKVMSSKKLRKRVIFHGSVAKEKDFSNAISACDYSILPYLEVGQCSSGPAAYALESQTNMITTSNFMFRELYKYATGCFEMFDVGNYHQLASTISNFDSAASTKAKEEYLRNFNVESRIDLYSKLISKALGA